MRILACMLALVTIGAAPAPQSLPDYLAGIAAAFPDPERFRAIAGATIFDGVAADERGAFGTPRIVRKARDGRSAIVLLSASSKDENSGDRTFISANWSGLYALSSVDGQWRLGERQSFESNRIESQRIEMKVQPASGITVRDTLSIQVESAAGFPVMLNANAQISSAAVDGRPVPFEFQNGLLWVDMAKGRHNLRIDYSLTPEPAEKGNSSAFAPEAGHLRNQYFWHPFYSFGTEKGRGRFSVSATIPAQYQLAFDIPQTDQVTGAARTVEAGTGSAEALTFAYDRDWKPVEAEAGGVALKLIATPDFTPRPEIITPAFARAVRVLSARFGQPSLDQIKIIQGRRRQGNGWHFFSNQAIFTGPAGGDPTRALGYPMRLFLGHEVAHLWTRPTGWARNFLGEGWATFAESLIIADEFGADGARRFWRDQARLLVASPAAMAVAMREDRTNSGVSYSKGSWALRMVERLVGPAAFDKAIAAFVAAPAGHSGYQDFLAGFGADRARVERFLDPWVSQTGLPALDVRASAGQLYVTQSGPAYWLPRMAVRLIYADGTDGLVRIDVDGPASVDLPEGRRPVRVELDPFEDFLLERRFFAMTGK